MAVGDLVTADYTFEYNGLAFGAGTEYYILEIQDFLGYKIRSKTIERFGRHGATAGRHFSNAKLPTFIGEFLASTDTEFETRRQAIGAAFAPIVAPDNKLELVTMWPGAGSAKIKAMVRPMHLDLPVNRSHTRKMAPYSLRFEQTDPMLYSLTATNTVFSMPTDTEVITNSGNAPAIWTASLVGPAENPSLTHNGTGQVISFSSLTLTNLETLTYDSSDSSAKVNGVSIGNTFAEGFSWFDLDPGTNSITMTATNAGTASFTLSHNDAYWIP